MDPRWNLIKANDIGSTVHHDGANNTIVKMVSREDMCRIGLEPDLETKIHEVCCAQTGLLCTKRSN